MVSRSTYTYIKSVKIGMVLFTFKNPPFLAQVQFLAIYSFRISYREKLHIFKKKVIKFPIKKVS